MTHRRRHKPLLLLTLIVLTWLGAATREAHAQPADGTPEDLKTNAMKEAAKELYDAAREARKTDDFATCHAKASAAWAIHHHPSIAALIGDCAIGIKNYRDAAERLTFFFASPQSEGSESLRLHLRQQLNTALLHVAVVKLGVAVDGATCDVDGRRVESLPSTIFLEPGKHVFEAQHPTHTTTTREETLLAGQEYDIKLDMLPVPAKLDPDPPPVENGHNSAYIVGASVSGVVTLGGIALTIASAVLHGQASDDAERLDAEIDRRSPGDNACSGGGGDLAAECSALQQAIDDQGTFATLFPVGLVITGLGLAAATTFVVLYFTDTDEASTSPEVSVSVSPTGGSLRVTF